MGKVKTRLAKTVGDEQALKIYKSLMTHTRKTVQAVDATRLLFYSDWINQNDEWSSLDFDKALQPEGSLGTRMAVAFDQGFQKGGPVLIVGSDCAGLSASIVQEAFAKLEKNDFVIGPALDGGYYLLGMKAYTPAVFENIEWSTDTVKKDTVKIISGLGKTVEELTPLSDIDFEADWKKYGWNVE